MPNSPASPTVTFLYLDLIEGLCIWIASHTQNYNRMKWKRACTIDTTDMSQHPVNHLIDHALKESMGGTLDQEQYFKTPNPIASVLLPFSFLTPTALLVWASCHLRLGPMGPSLNTLLEICTLCNSNWPCILVPFHEAYGKQFIVYPLSVVNGKVCACVQKWKNGFFPPIYAVCNFVLCIFTWGSERGQ